MPSASAEKHGVVERHDCREQYTGRVSNAGNVFGTGPYTAGASGDAEAFYELVRPYERAVFLSAERS